MLWWTLRQLKSESAAARRQAVVKLGRTAGVRAVELLSATLSDPDATVRQEAAATLKQFGAAATTPLIAALGDPSKAVRSTAAEALGTIGDRVAIGPLIAHLDTPAACEALVRFGPHAVQPLLAALVQGKAQVRERAAEALARIADPGSVSGLVAMLAHDDAALRRTAYRVLERVSPGWRESESARRNFSSLCQAVRHPGAGRGRALEALGFLGDPSAVEALIPALTDEGSDIRAASADVLGRLGDQQAVVPLLALLGDDYDLVRVSAAAALDRLQPGWRDTAAGRSAFQAMISDLRKPDPAVRKAAAIALDSLAWTAATDEDRALFLAALARWDGLPPLGEAAIDALLLVLRTSHTSELESAISTLSVIDPLWTQRGAAGAAVPALTSALTSISSAAVTTTVAGALVRIDPGWTRSAEARAVVPAMVSMLTSGRKIPLEQRTAIIAALGEIGDSRAVEALAAALNGQNALISPRAAEALANIRDSRAVEPLVRYLYAYPGSTDVVATAIRKLAPSSALSSHLAEYAVRAVGFRFRENSALASLDEAEAAVHALCSVDSPVTSNVLHLVAQLKDLSIAWNPNCLGDKYEVSRETLRNLAREELARRGNPPYRPEAYLRTECASGSSAPSPEHTQQPTTTL